MVSSGCWRPWSSPKIGASADQWPSMRTHEITSGTRLQPTSVATHRSWRAHPPLGRVLAHCRYPSRHPRCGRRIRAAGQYHRYPGRPSRCRQAGRTHSTCLSRTQFRLWRRRPRQKSMTAPVRISTAVFACSARRRSGHRFCSERRPRRINFGSSRLTPNRCNVKELPCVCAFRFIARAVRRHDTHHPRFVPVQDRSDARRQIAWPRSALAAGRRAAARLRPLADPADARAHVGLGGSYVARCPKAARCSARRFADEVDTFGRSSITFATVEGRKAPPSPWRVGVAKLETGSAVLTRTGADTRIVSTVNPDGFKLRS